MQQLCQTLSKTRTRRAFRGTACWLFVGLVLLLTAASAQARVFTLTLVNGTSFETRYRPVAADWDENYVMIRTELGNWIALAKSEVADVTSAAESSGFGYQVDSSTLFIGFTPGDVTLEGEEAEGAEAGAPGAALPPDTSAIEYGGSTGGASYGLDEFLDIPDDGNIASQPLSGGGGEN